VIGMMMDGANISPATVILIVTYSLAVMEEKGAHKNDK